MELSDAPPQYHRDVRRAVQFLALVRRLGWPVDRPPLLQLQPGFLGPHRIVESTRYYAAAMQLIGCSPRRTLNDYIAELLADDALRRQYTRALEQGWIGVKHQRYEDRCHLVANVVNYYAIIRELTPDVVVETGTAAGSMTSWILAALARNGRGRLISIDLPPVAGTLTMNVSIEQERVGFLIPPAYRDRWECIFGDARLLLAQTLIERPADVFIHDSLHTPTHMLFEYTVARALMRPGTLILSDDVFSNRAWIDFLSAHRLKGLGCASSPHLGLAVNVFDELETRAIDEAANRIRVPATRAVVDGRLHHPH